MNMDTSRMLGMQPAALDVDGCLCVWRDMRQALIHGKRGAGKRSLPVVSSTPCFELLSGSWAEGKKHGPGVYWDTSKGCLRGSWVKGTLQVSQAGMEGDLQDACTSVLRSQCFVSLLTTSQGAEPHVPPASAT